MKCVYLEKNDLGATLTTWLYCNFSMMYGAEQFGYQSYIHWPTGKFLQSYEDKEMFAKIPNAYEWYFEQPMLPVKPIAHSATWTWEIGGPWTTHPLITQPLDVIRKYYQRYLNFNLMTEARGQALVNKYGIDFSKTIGITWRGTDIYLESQNGYEGRKYTPIEYYFPWIDKALERIPDARIACTAEEEKILEPLFKRYPQAFLIEEFISVPKGSKHNPERFSKVSGYERGLQPALMVWLFSKCAWLIKNRASTSAVASWLSKGEIVNICHREILDHPPHLEGIEYKEQVYPI